MIVSQLSCDMSKECAAPVTHIDEDGFVYCTKHGLQRRDWKRCRKLRDAEYKKLVQGQSISYGR